MGLNATVDRAVNTAFRAMGNLVRPATYQSRTGNIARDLEAGTDVAEVVEYSVRRAVFASFKETEVDNSAVLITDQRIVFPASDLPVDPRVGDTILDFKGSQWIIMRRFDGPASAVVRVHVRPSSIETSPSVTLKKYWGVSTEPTLDSAGIMALGNSNSGTDRALSVVYNADGGRYVYYAYPSALGALALVAVAGLFFSDYSVTVVAFTDENGQTEDYNVVRIRNLQTGPVIPVNWS